MKYKLISTLLMLFSIILFNSCYDSCKGISKNLMIIGIEVDKYSGYHNKFIVKFSKMRPDGYSETKANVLNAYNLYDLQLLKDLKVQKLISDSLSKKGLIRLLDIDFDSKKIIKVSDYNQFELINELRNERRSSSSNIPKKSEEYSKMKDKRINKDDITVNSILISLIILITIEVLYIIAKVSQIRRYKRMISETGKTMSSLIVANRKYTYPDKDLRNSMIRLGYDPKIVNDIMDEVNKEIK